MKTQEVENGGWAHHGADRDFEGVRPVRVGDVVDLAVVDGGLDRDPAVRGSYQDLVEVAALVGVPGPVDVQHVGPGQDQPSGVYILA